MRLDRNNNNLPLGQLSATNTESNNNLPLGQLSATSTGLAPTEMGAQQSAFYPTLSQILQDRLAQVTSQNFSVVVDIAF